MTLVLFGAEQGGGLVYGLGLVEPGRCPQGGGDGHVQPPAAAGGVGQVDDCVLCPVQAGHGGAHGHGLARPGVAHDGSQGGLVYAVVDPGHRLGVRRPLEELVSRHGFCERSTGKTEVGGPDVNARHHSAASSSPAPQASMPGKDR